MNKHNPPKQRQAMLENMSQSQIVALSRLIKCFLRQDASVPKLTEREIKCLYPYREFMREVASDATSSAKKRRLFRELLAKKKPNQKGGILPLMALMAPLAAQAVAPMVGNLVSNALVK